MSGSLELQARARLGTVLRGKYRLDALLGSGGMAVVYKATHRNTAEFAIKMLRTDLSEDEEIRSRFLREGYAANSVKHPGAVTIVDDDVTEDGAAFLVMELLSGMTAEDLLVRAGASLPPSIAVALGVQLLDVLAAAHVRGILHRDIKPANLFVTNAGQVKLLDFGIARVRDAADQSARMTQTGATFGTPAFMSPEQARGKSKEVDARSDVWQVGATLYTLMTGTLVHQGENAQEILVLSATEPVQPIAQRRQDLPAELATIVDRALAFDKRDRWDSAASMRDALRATSPSSALTNDVLAQYLAVLPTADEAHGATTRPAFAAEPPVAATQNAISSDKQRALSRRRAQLGVAVGVIVLASTVLVTLFVLRHNAASAVAPPVLQTPVASERALASSASSDVPVATIVTVTVTATVPPAPSAIPSSIRSAPLASHLAKPHTSTPGSTAACNPNYVLDANGNKHFKAECFHR